LNTVGPTPAAPKEAAGHDRTKAKHSDQWKCLFQKGLVVGIGGFIP
jgi:hypothetical protein